MSTRECGTCGAIKTTLRVCATCLSVVEPTESVGKLLGQLAARGRAASESAERVSGMSPWGVWRHYKGGLYRVLFTAKLSEDHTTRVVAYVSLDRGEISIRHLYPAQGEDAWLDIIAWPDGVERTRFVYVDESVKP